MKAHPPETLRAFFAGSDWLDRMVLRPLSHITMNWEARWDASLERYEPEPNSFAEDLNVTVEAIAVRSRPDRYHDNEDVLVHRVVRHLKWPIQKKGGRWTGADYASILEQGAFKDLGQEQLLSAASGRVHAALDHGQEHFDEMEEGHLNMLAALMSIVIYHRYCDGTSLLTDVTEEDDH